MRRVLAVVVAFLLTAKAFAGPVEARLHQVHPCTNDAAFQRSAGQTRAVILVHGLRLERGAQGTALALQDWQRAGSPLVKELGRESDVFAFAYRQNVALDQVAGSEQLAQAIAKVRALGYPELVLVGHSAGGLIVRQFVEEHPAAGVTRVVQVCAPNAGTPLADQLRFLACKDQEVFVASLSPESRQQYRQAHPAVIPAAIEFVCVVGTGCGSGDGVLACDLQWPEELQEQGIPEVTVACRHTEIMGDPAGVDCVSKLVRATPPRHNGSLAAAGR